MTRRNRNTLKDYFAVGALPSATNFVDLVDSSLNMLDDGFSRSPENGVEIALEGGQYRRLMSFFPSPGADHPLWSINCDPAVNGNLGIASIQRQTDNVGEPHVLCLTPDGNVGIGVNSPEKLLAINLEVGGALKSVGRFGRYCTVPADGNWQDVTPDWLEGCQAFEVVAGVGLEGQKKGRYALLHAFALNTFNPKRRWFNFLLRKKPIRCQHAWYLSRGDRLQLRWIGQDEIPNEDGSDPHKYKLQIKTVTSYGEGLNGKGIEIQYSITRLWFDDFMAKSTPGNESAPIPQMHRTEGKKIGHHVHTAKKAHSQQG